MGEKGGEKGDERQLWTAMPIADTAHRVATIPSFNFSFFLLPLSSYLWSPREGLRW